MVRFGVYVPVGGEVLDEGGNEGKVRQVRLRMKPGVDMVVSVIGL